MPKNLKPAAVDYAVLSQELETIINQLQSEDTNIDQALKRYERGLELIKQLENYLQSAENKITELQTSLNPLK